MSYSINGTKICLWSFWNAVEQCSLKVGNDITERSLALMIKCVFVYLYNWQQLVIYNLQPQFACKYILQNTKFHRHEIKMRYLWSFTKTMVQPGLLGIQFEILTLFSLWIALVHVKSLISLYSRSTLHFGDLFLTNYIGYDSVWLWTFESHMFSKTECRSLTY
jgi:hypothetical protein